jgi:hypothetical protein
MAKVHDSATDLITFARGSSGTALRRVGYGENLVTNGDFATTDISAWDSFDGTLAVVGGQLELTYTTATQYVWVEVTTTPGTLYEFSIDCRSDNAVGHKLLAYSDAFPLGTQIATNPSFVNFSASLTTQTLRVRATASTTLFMVSTQLTSGTAYFDNISVKEVIFDRATDDLVLYNHPDDTPRIEYGSDGSLKGLLKGLLIEEQRTNLVTYSEDFSQWTTGSTTVEVNTSETLSPSGQNNATKVTWGGSVIYAVQSSVKTGAPTITGSVWVKGAAGETVRFAQETTGGTYVSNYTAFTLTGGWQRIDNQITLAGNNDNAGTLMILMVGNTNPASSVYIYGAQIEQGSFATSYIPTSGSQVTRSADVASIPVSAFGYNQDAGTWLMEWDTADTGNVQTKYVLSSGNSARVMYNNAGSPAFYSYDGSAVSTYTTSTAITFDGSHIKAAYAEDDGGASVAHTGVLGNGNGASDLLPNYNPTYGWSIGSQNNASNFLNGHIKSIQYYPRRLTDAQLQELTA